MRILGALSGQSQDARRVAREVFAVSGAKDDPTDALLLLQLLRVPGESLRPFRPHTSLTRTLQLLCEHRRKAVNDRLRITNRLTRLLKDSFPQALDWAGDLKLVKTCDWLIKWPSLAALQKARPSQVRAFYGRSRARAIGPRRFGDLALPDPRRPAADH